MSKRSRAAVAALALVTGGCTTVSSPPVVAETHSLGPVVPSSSPDARYIRPRGVTGVSANEAWAVGHYRNPPTGAYNTLILHWDGTGWSPVASPNPRGAGYRLLGVSADSPTDAWAVGSNRDRSSFAGETLILHWDGTSWSQVPSPNPSRDNSLVGVSANSPTDAWAVGNYYDSNLALVALILHWDGTSWSQVASPNPSRDVNRLSSVSATSADDAWAVGSYRNDATLAGETLILHWDGTSWSQVPSPNPTTDSYLTGVSADSATDAWAVGNSYKRIRNGAFDTLILYWDGTSWSQVPSPNASRYNYLFAVSAVSATDAWAVGYYGRQGYRGSHRTLILHWDGTSWSQVASPNPSERLNHLRGVSADSADNAWAVGYYRNDTNGVLDTMILHWDGTSWSKT